MSIEVLAQTLKVMPHSSPRFHLLSRVKAFGNSVVLESCFLSSTTELPDFDFSLRRQANFALEVSLSDVGTLCSSPHCCLTAQSHKLAPWRE